LRKLALSQYVAEFFLMKKMKTYHIHIKGIVQGVGFRPFVYKTALHQQLKGWVNNTHDGVHIEINSDKKTAQKFLDQLLKNLPPLAVVTDYSLKETKNRNYTDFQIIKSTKKGLPNLLITPDVAMCKDCRNELHNPGNRRYQYPFITCTNCGPRYSIITRLPYDRPHTTMAEFQMCEVCLDEYNNPMERRHYSQTNSCPDCPVEMQWYENEKVTENFTNLDKVIDYWQQGKIIAIKGIGGYLLTCDASNEKAIQTLRTRKKRPYKPFALMYPDIKSALKDVFINKTEKEALQSNEAPIVLLPLKKKTGNVLPLDKINSGLGRIGIMLPYTPLYELLLSKYGRPIIATSGNITGSTIIYKDTDAIKELSKIADVILMNNRKIVVPQDDSVVQFTEKHRQKIVLRRSRGKAPVYINPQLNVEEQSILATGSMLKSVFAFSHQKNIYVSQFLGDTEIFEAQQNYEQTFQHLTNILQPKFDKVVTDMHPAYFATQFGQKTALEQSIPQISIQHHKAHFISVLGENNLWNNKEKVLGVIWDGTGLGDDGNIWGGEFFSFENHQINRLQHIGEFDFILADKMVREPRISLLALTHQMPDAEIFVKQKFSDTEWKIYRQLLRNTRLKSTSMGRLFDAVSSLLFSNDIHTYEAEASMKLEWKAHQYLQTHSKPESYLSEKLPAHFVSFIMKKIITNLAQNKDKGLIAAQFHVSLADYIRLSAQKYDYKNIAFSGGVFQNALLVDLIIEQMQRKYNLYFHKEFSPNDEGIAFGQLLYGFYKSG